MKEKTFSILPFLIVVVTQIFKSALTKVFNHKQAVLCLSQLL